MIHVLQINEVHVSDLPVEYVCYGLGSCIGLFLTDRQRGISGGAHIPLATSGDQQQWSDASQLISMLLSQLEKMGCDLATLRAKITGGAHIYRAESTVGRQNIEAVHRHLVQKRIYIAASDTGGQISRTVRFNSRTFEARISTSEQKMYSI